MGVGEGCYLRRVAKEGGYTLLYGPLVPVPMFLQTKGSHMAVIFLLRG